MKQLLLVFIFGFVLSACGMNSNQAQEGQNPQGQAKQSPQGQNVVNVKNSTFQEVDRATGQEISKHLVDLATSIPNVNDATAIVIGKYAIVGIDINSNLERSEVGSIKYSVAESLKKDPHGANAMIIADPDLNARLKEIQKDIEDGKPIQGIVNELADIAGRMIPEIPADIIDPNAKKATEDSNQKLNKPEENELEKEQQEQSNNQK